MRIDSWRALQRVQQGYWQSPKAGLEAPEVQPRQVCRQAQWVRQGELLTLSEVVPTVAFGE
jgi:hypothetical protein